MRRATSILVAYVLVAGVAGFALSRALPGSRPGVYAPLLPGLIPVAMLAVVITLWGRSRGWICAVVGLLLSMLVAASLMRPAQSWFGSFAVVPASVVFMIALLRSGGWQTVRRHRWLAAAVAGCAGLLVVATVAATAIYVATYHPSPGCVDTCVGPLIAVVLVIYIVSAVIVLLSAAAAFAKSWVTGLGALIMFLAQFAVKADALPLPAYNLRWAFLVATWYVALFAVVSPWTWPTKQIQPG